MLDTFSDADGKASVTADARAVVVVGLGNSYRRDDGVAVAAAAALDGVVSPNVHVIGGIADPMALLEAWSGAGLAVVLDAAVSNPSTPGRVRRCDLSDVDSRSEGLSSHTIDIVRTHALGRALGRVPGALVVFTIDVADTGYGTGLTPDVAAAVPRVVGMVMAEINHTWGPATQSRRPASW
jgi:hydrogenase maturation protease